MTDPVCNQIAVLIDRLADEPVTSAGERDGDAAVLARLRDVSVLIDRLEGHRLGVLRAPEQLGVLQRDSFANPSVWLRRSTSLTHAEAGRRGKVTKRLHALPEITQALEDGRIGVAHASLIDRLAGDVGVDHVAAVQRPLIVAAVRLRDVAEFATLCAGWRHALAPDYLDERDDKNWEHRRAGFATINGRGQLWGSFDAHGAALFAAAVDVLMTEDGPEIPEDARRTREQRVADAITDMAARVLDSGDAPEKAGQRPHVTVTLGADTLAGQPGSPPASVDWVGAVGRKTALDLLDDCSFTRLLLGQRSQPMDVGTATRVWPGRDPQSRHHPRRPLPLPRL
ncbi:MAG: DUF222 domain-containing protein [Egibacteraceae bacterium]